MTTPIQYPLINGVRYDYSAISYGSSAFAGLPMVGITEIEYSQELAGGDVRGTLPQQMGATRGQLKTDGSFTILLLEYDNLIQQLCVINGTPGSGFMEARWDLLVQYQALVSGAPGPLIQDTIRGMKLKKVNKAHKAGPDALVVKCDVEFFYALENGRAPLGISNAVGNGFIPG
jgi:hypothetical protein